MNKVKIPNINFESEIFNVARAALDTAILRVLDKCYTGEFESGDVSLKLTIGIADDHIELPAENELGELGSAVYEYRRPSFRSTVATTLKKTSKREDVIFIDGEIKEIDGDFALVELPKAQVELQDIYSDFDFGL